ncbi:MAG: hypothetical protein Q9180_004856, partial [Flavoplaca navasiana]
MASSPGKSPATAESSLSTPPPESPSKPKHDSSNFKYVLSLLPLRKHSPVHLFPCIIETYTHLLHSQPTLTMPLAAISSLISLLRHSPPSTTSETLSLLSHHSSILKSSVRNPIALSAGTDLFQRYIVSTLQSPSSSNTDTQSTQDFKTIRDQLVANGEQFVARAQEARGTIAKIGVRFVDDG